ncbi:Cobyrinic acid ac-diamide synthase [Desulfitobacterium hafniense DCB-2]|uniref:Cobyrinic acid ac-diamide synthase n=1 Tax=Desulfitobacterium hafniense (strain DSM 10664 / DCB-2) TaxID=272564 RepID=B8FTP9_DESHD|nr:MinD/ParA family protein [Desulfitobacterium hafniense]ACL22141.1 Cobyrinic acid ac-diamide synthase [Desulfitobacterium hafniense DCB-2]
MNDQAKVLRRIASRHKPDLTANSDSQQELRVFAVTSGKGGVGKTNFSVNLGLALIDLGYRVILLDGDLGLANLDIACGVTPRYTFEHLLNGEKDIEEILIYGPKGIGILPGGSGVQDLANIERERLEEVVRNLGRLESLADIIIIDTGAGLGHTVLNFLRAADDIILVTTPEPTALTDAYGLLKALQKVKDGVTVNVVVNRVQREADAKDTYERLESAAKRFLNAPVNLLGWVYEDISVGRAIMKQEPVGVSYPQSSAYQCIQWIAGSVSGLYLSPPRQAGGIRGFLKNLLRAF